MLSILIPIYNSSVVNLVTRLKELCEAEDIKYEILCLDDDSKKEIKEKNRVIESWVGVNYVELSDNMGRARIRNKLASLARYELLLMLDGDSQITSDRFIANYIHFFGSSTCKICYGGTVYEEKQRITKEYMLHWLYGTKREALKAKKREKSPILHFHTNNFLLHKSVLNLVSFNPSLDQYGYEDLLFAFQSQTAGETICHIDNPVLHDGLKTTDVFLKDIQTSCAQLARLKKENKIGNTTLTEWVMKMQKTGILRPLLWVCTWVYPLILKNLHSTNPFLWSLDLYKLKFYSENMIEKR
jgi:glycosyltransferase involved in cell wall biosynthesis